MGPRFHKRGNCASGAGRGVCAVCFNGAALSQTRKWPRPWASCPSGSRFNGAALSQTRKCSAAAAALSYLGRLQWGRAFTNAEIIPCPKGPNQRVKASMGPRFHKRGNVPEFWQARVRHLASMGPRFHKRGNVVFRIGPSWKLLHASMGPRFHKRGNRKCRTGGNGSQALQWGRAFTNAEIEIVRGHPPTERGFNGAALSRTRKSDDRTTDHLLVFLASMGPRFHERGNVIRSHPHAVHVDGFNGAALSRTRKWFALSPGEVGRRLLQWGRAFTNAEI